MNPVFYFYANPYQPDSVRAARALAVEVEKRGGLIYTEAWLSREGIGKSLELENMPLEARALVAFGGDGTLLRAAPQAAKRNVPIFGVHTGTVGFLMEGEANAPEKAADILFQEPFSLAAYPMLKIRYEEQTYLALNDLALTRGEHPGVIETTVWCDGEMVMNPHGDGVVIATPLGSTAYALSSGGPILRPDAPCLTVTPIAARELLLRTVLLPLDAELTLRVHGSGRRRLQLALDGQTLLPITAEADIAIHAAAGSAQLIRPGNHQFFTTLRRKQRMWNDETEQE